MELKEVFVALQTGVMDGQENPLTQIYSQKFQEVQKYLSLTGHVYTPAYLTAGASWSRLPADVQKILADTAKEVEPDILKLAAKLDGELIGKMKTSGIQVNEANKPAFVAASKDGLRGVLQGSPDRQGADRQVAGARPRAHKQQIDAPGPYGPGASFASRPRLAPAEPIFMNLPHSAQLYDRVLEAIAAALMASSPLIIVAGFFFRWIGYSLVWYDEVGAISLCWLTYYAGALAALRGAHIGFPGLVNALPAKLRGWPRPSSPRPSPSSSSACWRSWASRWCES